MKAASDEKEIGSFREVMHPWFPITYTLLTRSTRHFKSIQSRAQRKHLRASGRKCEMKISISISSPLLVITKLAIPEGWLIIFQIPDKASRRCNQPDWPTGSVGSRICCWFLLQWQGSACQSQRALAYQHRRKHRTFAKRWTSLWPADNEVPKLRG